MTLRYKPFVTRAQDENGQRDKFDNGEPVEAWDIYTNPYSRRPGLRRPKFHQAMQVCVALQRGVPEEDLTFTFEGMCGLLDLIIAKVTGEFD